MALLLDALALEVGMDPTKFRKGQVEVSAALRKTREAAQKEGAGIERAVDKAGESLERLARNALKLFAIFTTGRAVKDFVADITASDAALGRLAKSLETTPQALSALGGAVSRSGGSADAAANSFQRLANSYNELKLTGRSATYDMLSRISGATGKVIRYGKDTQRTLYDIADAAKAMSEQSGVSFTTNILEQAGLDPGTISLLIQGSEKMREAQEKVKRLGGVVSKQDTENAQRFSTALHDVGTISEGLGRTIWTNLSPAISEIIEKVVKWYEANGEWLRSEIAEKVKMLADYLRSIDWEAIGTGIKEFASGANEAAKAVGGWKVVFEALLGAWLFTKLLALLRVLGLIRLAITGSATPGIFGTLIGALGIGGTAAVGAAVGTAIGADAAVPNAAKPGVSNNWDDEASGAAGGAGMGSVLRRGYRAARRGLGRIFGGGGGNAAGAGAAGPGASSRTITRLAQGQNVQAIIATLKAAGYKDNAIAAVVGSMQTESTFNPRAANNQSGGHTGLWQWDRHRWPHVEKWIRDQGGDPYSVEWQTKAWIAEHNAKPGDPMYDHPRTARGGEILRGNPTIDEAIHGVRESERFGPGEEGGRANNARRWLPHVSGAAAAQPAPTAPGGDQGTFPNGAPRILKPDSMPGAPGVTMQEVERARAARSGAGRRPDVLADPADERRKAQAAASTAEVVAAARAGQAARIARATEAPASKSDAAFDAARRAGAMASLASANAASATVASRVSNDNRNTDNRRYDETHLHNVSVYPATGTQSAIMAELKQAARGGKAFAAEADYGKA